MTREQIIEAMARAFLDALDHDDFYVGDDLTDLTSIVIDGSGDTVKPMRAALTALETAIPGLADVISGKAVVVPREPSKEMSDAGYLRMCDHHHLTPDDVYRAMIQAGKAGT